MNAKLQFNFSTTQQIIQKIAAIDAFKAKWLATVPKDNRYLQELKRMATIQSIGSSTRIEGATLTDREVERLLKNVDVNASQSRDEAEVMGYYDALDFILSSYRSIEVNKQSILDLHSILLKYSDKDEFHRGRYKQHPNKIVATYPNGKQKVIFETTAPKLVPQAMYQLLDWTQNAFAQQSIHPLMTIATFAYELLSIHPFHDGNGRLTRLLTTLLLLQYNYSFVQYISFEQEIEQHKLRYYQALRSAQRHRHTSKEVIEEWMLFFLNGLLDIIQRLEKKYQHYQQKGGYLNERQKKVLSCIQAQEPTKVSDLSQTLTTVSINTIKKDLQYLVTEQFVEKLGKGRGTIYVIRDR